MKVRLRHLVVRTRKTVERIDFSEAVTFLHGPVSTGKSTVARLVDYCLGGDLERTPAIQQEFIAVDLALVLGKYECMIERGAEDTQGVRVTWSGSGDDRGSAYAPFSATNVRLLDADVYNFSGVIPIKVRQRSRDPDSPVVRLSIRDIWWYCYLDQAHLDSSFFRLEDPFRGRKSQDAMRFFTGLHSERLSMLDAEVMRAIDEQRAKREAVQQIRSFMARFDLGSELDIEGQREITLKHLKEAESKRAELERTRSAQIHPTDDLRNELRNLSTQIESTRQALEETSSSISEQRALRAEFITAKTKAERVDRAGRILEGAGFQRCPECGTDISNRPDTDWECRLCCSPSRSIASATPVELEVLRRDLNERIDQIEDAIRRREGAVARMRKQLTLAKDRKVSLDKQLQEELARYDSAFVEDIRGAERVVATLIERLRSLKRLQRMPEAVSALEFEAGALQGEIDRLHTAVAEERNRLRAADENVSAIAAEFKRVMLAVFFPGVSEDDKVVIDPRDWKPWVTHGLQQWDFWDAGSGGKKTLFNVCYALAVHSVAVERGMPVPDVLIIDSPTKNISEEENPELVRALYAEIYRLAGRSNGRTLQFLLIDSDFVAPHFAMPAFSERRMAGEAGAPSLIPYYEGP
jgi:TolA-binding protein